ncbi:MAG: F0F1 ATP synthase subunit gamma, partial [Deltaproteobacteria bacterium]|nr:F0F1 ATP synthase subunit gamma [Deltaproteobacteria bacterium]
MEAVEPLRRRVDVLQELREVVKTMKTIAAVTIRQYEKAVVSLRRYSRTIEMGMQVVMRGREAGLEMQPFSGRCLTMIVFGSEFGMCG